MMRLELLGAVELSSFKRAMALTKAEYVLASRGVRLSECVEAIAAEARKDQPEASHWSALMDAEAAALTAAFGSPKKAGRAVLGVIVSKDRLGKQLD